MTAHPPADADAVLAGLDPEQRAVATALRGPVCVLAGAGTGKTRAITHRVAYGVHSGVYAPQRVLAVTFTTRAAGEMRGRLRGLGVGGVQARTFHSAALRQLGYFWPKVVGGQLPRLVPSKAGLVAEAAGRSRLRPGPAGIRDLAAEIEWAKVTRTAPDDYALAAGRAGRTAPADLDHAQVAQVYAGYEETKRARGVLDFEDVLLLTVAILEERADVADAVRAQYRHLVVDEYQDVNPLQQALLELWLGGRDDVCVVGDAAQTIYGFTGASPAYLLGFPQRYPGATVVRLVRDYRSTPQVVALANGLLRGARGRVSQAGVELVAQRPAGPAPTFAAHPDEPAEAAATAARVRTLLAAGTPASEIAVLYRINAQSEVFEEALADAGIPYLLRGAERFFERPEVREAVLLLRGAARAGGSVAADADLAPPGTLADDVRAVLASAGWQPQPPSGAGATRDRWESLNALVGLAEQLTADRPDAGLSQLVAELDERIAAQHAPTVEGVTLASLHAAKGLEWDAVFLVGLVDGTLPISYAETPEQVEEERRLLYVGVTRAREHLSLSWAAARAPGGRAVRRPSRFLDGLRPADDEPAAGRAGSADRRRGRRGRAGGVLPTVCSGCGAPLVSGADRTRGRCADCPPAYDEAVFERLRAWRLERARTDSVPAYVVFTDATLEAIAARRPASLGELAEINGVGPAKLQRYGAEVLEQLAGA
ncbi:MAG: ATP-dependent DNA helicase UvrD2 [Actinomycetia bacterium]|nr:ATP-dependent DNA helicase UvrD2 [Actinomycetes bacterium]